MAATATPLVTFADLERLPEPEGFRYELHHGELIQVAPPKQKHFLLQRRLRQALETVLGGHGIVDTEIGFRPTREHDYRIADVAFVTHQRWSQIPADGNLQGAPEIVIEVLLPSSGASEIMDKEHICLANGSQEFWVVDPSKRRVKVSTKNGHAWYAESGQIPLPFGGALSVDSVFGD